jgi:hypothetical protein
VGLCEDRGVFRQSYGHLSIVDWTASCGANDGECRGAGETWTEGAMKDGLMRRFLIVGVTHWD